MVGGSGCHPLALFAGVRSTRCPPAGQPEGVIPLSSGGRAGVQAQWSHSSALSVETPQGPQPWTRTAPLLPAPCASQALLLDTSTAPPATSPRQHTGPCGGLLPRGPWPGRSWPP